VLDLDSGGATDVVCIQRALVSFEGGTEVFETLEYTLHSVDQVQEDNLAVRLEFDARPMYPCENAHLFNNRRFSRVSCTKEENLDRFQ